MKMKAKEKFHTAAYTRGDPKVTGNIFWWAGPL